MKTSYFAKVGKLGLKTFSIALSKPDFYYGPEYRDLAPPSWLLQRYHLDHDFIKYTDDYIKGVLDKLDPQKVFDDLGDDAVLLCWEKPLSFCHRHIVADWLGGNLGIEVTEL